jgi:hypothetical protein
MVRLPKIRLWRGGRDIGFGLNHYLDRLPAGRTKAVTIRFKNSPLGITANKLNKAFLASGGGGTGTGDMTKAVYDADGNGIVDTADSIPWTKVTGKPVALGDMTKAVYDTNNDGISDHAALADTATSATTAAAVPWTGITGRPSTFPPDSTAMLKSVYDTNGDSIVDHAALSDAVPWTGISGRPSTFPPDSTAMLKATYDINGNGKVDGAETADSVPWTGITGKPTLPDPGVWTNLSLASGWSVPVQAQYRVDVSGSITTIHFRGMIQAAYSAMGTTAFTAPVGARPSMTRSTVLGGAQATGTPSDVASYIASVASSGVCTIYFLGAGPFVWADPAQTQQVYLDGLSYSL